MTTRPQRVPLEPLPRWGGAPDSMLAAHIGTTDYLLGSRSSHTVDVPQERYIRNEDLWNHIIAHRVEARTEIVLEHFPVMDWFPRSPGL